jgi:lysophospholipase L1-like esterase
MTYTSTMHNISVTGLCHSFHHVFNTLPVLGIVLLTSGSFSLCYAEPTGISSSATKWVGTWSTAPQLVEPGNNPPTPGLSNNTLRQIVRVSLGGDSLRMRLSNEFSTSPATVHAVHIAISKGGSAIDTSTDKVLHFAGKVEITIAPGAAITSDPFPFAVQPRTDLAITIYFGSTSPDITGHPGSRTTSYLLTGNEVSRVDFSGAVTTDHWYAINAIDVLAPSTAACVAILGNSITDGRGSTTNLQNRWTDVFSVSLLKDSGTQQVGVLNLGIGGNCVLSGGLGPTGVSRFDRDILNQQGVRWVIVFEGVNDIGGVSSATSATTTSNNLISAYKQMIVKAHAQNIRIYGGTILPFNGNSYYNQYSELCRNAVNQWIRTKGNYDGCIDFDMAMRNPQDTTRLVSTYQNDGLHPDAAGYKTMGESIDRGLFAGSDTVFQQVTGIESLWFEAERYPTAGSEFTIVSDAAASNGKYITVQAGVQSLSAAPTDSAGLITIPFAVTKDSTYHVFGRVNCPTYDDDSFWAKVDDSTFVNCNGLKTSGWAWMKLNSYLLPKGRHTLTIGYREDGACLDKLCITNYMLAPTGMGEADPATLGVNCIEAIDGYVLGQNYPNPFNPASTISYDIPYGGIVSLKVYDVIGREVGNLVNERQEPGRYSVNFHASRLSSGMYVYKLSSGRFTQTKKMMLVR